MNDHTRDTYIAVFSCINRPGETRTEIVITVIPLEINQEMLFWHTSFWRCILRSMSYYEGCVDSVCSVIGRPGDNIRVSVRNRPRDKQRDVRSRRYRPVDV